MSSIISLVFVPPKKVFMTLSDYGPPVKTQRHFHESYIDSKEVYIEKSVLQEQSFWLVIKP